MGAMDDLNKMLEDIKQQSRAQSPKGFQAGGGKPLAEDFSPAKQKKEETAASRPFRKRERSLADETGGAGEMIFFGILSSLLLITIGAASSLEYLSLIGALGAILFLITLFLKVFDFSAVSRKDDSYELEEIRKQIADLNLKSGHGLGFGSDEEERIRKTEEKVDELREIVKSLAKAVREKEG